jgi:hypothetical protein
MFESSSICLEARGAARVADAGAASALEATAKRAASASPTGSEEADRVGGTEAALATVALVETMSATDASAVVEPKARLGHFHDTIPLRRLVRPRQAGKIK